MIVSNDNRLPLLNGLVLIGGRSLRMGRPKEKMHWHGKEQVYYLADMLGNYCDEVYISCRAEQRDEIAGGEEMTSTYAWLSDRYTDIGPMGGILTAFKFRPDRAWLIVACDLPLVDSEALAYLIQHRDPQRIATAFKNPQDSLPEPLFAIWEPSSLPILQQMQAQHKLSPRWALIQHQALGIEAPHVNTLVNVNTPAEADSVKAMINNND